jgi:hypothetical protein
MSRTILVITVSLCVLVGCKRHSVIPAYLAIDSMEVITNYPTEGSASHRIVDAWVYVDDDAVGVYQLPTILPITLAGNHEISILAGVLKDGKSVERIAYPFYSLFSTDLELVTGEVDTVMPNVGYTGPTTFLAIEDFDAAATGFGMSRTTIDSLVFEGTGSGMVAMNLTTPGVTTESDLYVIPSDGSPVFLELNYRNDTPFDIYLYDSKTSQDHYIITITPKDLWNKVYVDLTVAVNRYAANEYRVKFRSELPDNASQAVNYWDNIKILHL